MEFDDEKLPNEDSMRLMRHGYAQKVRALQNEEENTNNNQNGAGSVPNGNTTNGTNSPNANETDDEALNAIANNINWQTNTQLLNNLLSRTQNRCMRSFIRGLIPLNESDRNEINSFYTNTRIRRNPSIVPNVSNTFNGALRDYIRNETELLDGLVELLYTDTDSNRRTSITNIIRRRLDALDTLASFMTGMFF